jgi:hypothetical protein
VLAEDNSESITVVASETDVSQRLPRRRLVISRSANNAGRYALYESEAFDHLDGTNY